LVKLGIEVVIGEHFTLLDHERREKHGLEQFTTGEWRWVGQGASGPDPASGSASH
jgi:hypothetical protein